MVVFFFLEKLAGAIPHFSLRGKLKYFFFFFFYCTVSNTLQILMFQQFSRRGFYGRSRFIWSQDTLGIIIRGYFQFHKSVPSLHRSSLVQIAPHLRALIREYIKSLIAITPFVEDHFERICARWIRLPSLGAVLSKLRECHRLVHSVNAALCLYTYESLRDDRLISLDFYNAIITYISRHSASHSGCCLHSLPALPRPSSLPSHGCCFFCGSGLTDKIDWNFIPKCSCVGYNEEEVCVCSVCLDEIADD